MQKHMYPYIFPKPSLILLLRLAGGPGKSTRLESLHPFLICETGGNIIHPVGQLGGSKEAQHGKLLV